MGVDMKDVPGSCLHNNEDFTQSWGHKEGDLTR